MQIGVKDVYIALMTTEDTKTSQAVYGTPIHIPGIQELGIEPSSNLNPVYADDGVYGVIDGKGEYKITPMFAEISNYIRATLQGSEYNAANNSILEKSDDTPPYFALMFKSKKSNGNYRYKVYYKCKANMVKDAAHKTKEPSPTLATSSIDFMSINRMYDKRCTANFDEPEFAGGATFFDAPLEFSSDEIAPTVTTVPLDAANGVAVDSTFVWTFSEAMNAALLTSANLKVIKASDGTAVAGSLAISTVTNTNDTVTFTPTSDLDAATDYIGIANKNIKDVAGNALANDVYTNFQTA